MTATELIVSSLIGVGLILSGWLSLPACLVDQAVPSGQGDAHRAACENVRNVDGNAADPANALSSLCPFCSPIARTEADALHRPIQQLSSFLAPVDTSLITPPSVLRPPPSSVNRCHSASCVPTPMAAKLEGHLRRINSGQETESEGESQR